MRTLVTAKSLGVQRQFWFTVLFDFMQHFRDFTVSEVGGLATVKKNYQDQALPSSHSLTTNNVLINGCFMQTIVQSKANRGLRYKHEV